MSTNKPTTALKDDEYEALFQALTSSSRGRWFMEEYLRRNQKPDTQILLDAIARLEKSITRSRTVPDVNRIRLDIADMQEAIERTKQEISNIKHESLDGNRFQEASHELDAIVTHTEGATQDILAAAEAIQEIAWTLRENGASEESCDNIDAHATEIFMACSFQDLTGQRTQKIVHVLQYLESRINLMINIWGLEGSEADDPQMHIDQRPDAHLLNGPQLAGKGVGQDAIDAMMFDAAPTADAADAPNEMAETKPLDLNDFDFDKIETQSEEEPEVFASAPSSPTEDTPPSDAATEEDATPTPEAATKNIEDDVEMTDVDEINKIPEIENISEEQWKEKLADQSKLEEHESEEDELDHLSTGERQAIFS